MLEAWRYYKDLYIDHNKIDSDLPDYSVAVKLDSSNFNFNRSTGNDIRFVLPDRTILKYERELYDSANQKAVYHVKIPTAYSSADTPFRMYFGNPSAANGADPTNVWDNGFKMVQHMNDNPDTSHIKDSTINANNGTKYAANQPTEADGVIGKAQSFDGVDDYISVPNFYNPATITVECIVNITADDDWLLNKRDNASDIQWQLYHYKGNLYVAIFPGNGTNIGYVSADSIINAGNKYIAFTTTGVNGGLLTLYTDGVSDGSVNLSGDMKLGARELVIGKQGWDAGGFVTGIIDEISISNTVRSPAYIKANDYNLRLNTLLIYGATRANTNSLFFSNNF